MNTISDNGNHPDPILSYLRSQKDELRSKFRSKKEELEDLRGKITEIGAQLDEIKRHLCHIDTMEADRLKVVDPAAANSVENPTLPALGRYRGLKPQEAIMLLFESEPQARFSAAEIYQKLNAEGFEISSTGSPIPTIFTTCKRLKDKGLLRERLSHGNRREFFLAKR